jgi:hypothetical protein
MTSYIDTCQSKWNYGTLAWAGELEKDKFESLVYDLAEVEAAAESRTIYCTTRCV